MLCEELVGKHAQAIDGGRFDAEHNWAQRDRLAPAAPREGQLGRSEVAFRADQHQHAGGAKFVSSLELRQHLLQVEGAGLERADELQLRRLGLLEEFRQRARFRDLRQPVLAALLCRFNRNRLPLRLFLRRVVGPEAHDRAIRHDRDNLSRADLDRFLHDQIHVLPLRNGLAQRDAAGQRRGTVFVQPPQHDLAALQRHDFGGYFAAAAVEDNRLVAGLKTENVVGVMRFAPAKAKRLRLPFVRREIEAMHRRGRVRTR